MRRLLLPLAIAAPIIASSPNTYAAKDLNALVWCDHSDPALLRPFEEEHGIRVNVREYEGTGTALALVEQSRPGDWDVFVIDGIDVPRALDANLLAELPPESLPMNDLFPALVMADNHTRDGKMYAVSEKFGYNTIAYNRDKVDPEDMKSMSIVWDEKYAGRIAVYDYYLPVMGMVAMGLGKKTSELSAADLPAIRDKLFAMKRVTRLIGEVVQSQTALATGEADILVGGGEWVTAGLSAENPSLDWVLPDEGGVRWSQSIGVFRESENFEMALKFVQYILSPEGQARLATSSCFWAMPANAKAGAHLDRQQKRALRWDDQQAFIANSQLYPAPSTELDAQMLEVWTEFLQH